MTMLDLPKRKNMRLDDYDYSQNGAYFITTCTQDKERTLAQIVGQGLCSCRSSECVLTPIGQTIQNKLEKRPAPFEKK